MNLTWFFLSLFKMTYKTKLQLSSKHVFTATAHNNTWSHQRRKRRQEKRHRLGSNESHDVTETKDSSNRTEEHSLRSVHDTYIGDEARVAPMETQGAVENSNEMTSQPYNLQSQSNLRESLTDPAHNPVADEQHSNWTEIGDKQNHNERKRSLEQDSDGKLDKTCVKRQKLADNNSEPVSESKAKVETDFSDKADTDSSNNIRNEAFDKECLIECEISVHKEVSGIVIQMEWIDGSARDAMQQVMQFIKNRIK